MDLNTNYFFRNVIICNVFYGSIARGRIDLVNSFLQLGADPALATGEWNAAKLARSMQHNTVANVLEMYQSEKAESLLQNYKFRYDEDTVNVDLVLDLLHLIDQQNSDGAVLIFLPGYDEIMNIRDRIMYNDSRFAGSGKFEVNLRDSAGMFYQSEFFK